MKEKQLKITTIKKAVYSSFSGIRVIFSYESDVFIVLIEKDFRCEDYKIIHNGIDLAIIIEIIEHYYSSKKVKLDRKDFLKKFKQFKKQVGGIK